MSSNGSSSSATGSNRNESRQPVPEGAYLVTPSEPERQAYVQAEGSSHAPHSSANGTTSTRLGGGGGGGGGDVQERPARVQNDSTICYVPGCDRMAEASQMSEGGRINRMCAEHKQPALMVTTVTVAEKCEHDGCERTPRYGVHGEPLSFCQGHKRAGMYTCRGGELFVATRDGSAFRRTGASAAADATDARQQSPNPAPPQEVPDPAPPQEVPNPAPAQEAPSPAPAQEAMIESFISALPPKVCEEPGCELQPSFGVPGSSNPQYCLSHKKQGLVSMKNRPCLYPRCNTRPHYGMSRGKAVFCVTHKLNGMVHLLKEAKTLEKEAHAMRRRKSRLNIAAKKARLEQEAKAEKVEQVAEKSTLEPEEDEGESRENEDKGKRPARAKGAARKAAVAEEDMHEKGCSTADSGAPCSSSSSPPPPQPPSSTAASSPGTTSGPKQRKPYSSRMSDAPGLAPSDEMRLFQEARELARAKAAASGSGRRARAPSRKVLEASGKLAGGSIQWMTKEKREEHARRSQEMREKRKAAAAEGLRLGTVIEPITLPSTMDAAGSDAGVGGGDVGGAPSGGASSGARSGGSFSSSVFSCAGASPADTESGCISRGATPSRSFSSAGASSRSPSSGATSSGNFSNGAEAPGARVFGRQLSSAEKGPAAETPASNGEAKENSPGNREATDNAKERESPVAVAAATEAGTISAKRWNANSPDVETDEARTSKRSKHASDDAAPGGSKDKSSKTVCESESCSKTAKYGINGIVRYCKKHHIFGMQKIVDAQ